MRAKVIAMHQAKKLLPSLTNNTQNRRNFNQITKQPVQFMTRLIQMTRRYPKRFE